MVGAGVTSDASSSRHPAAPGCDVVLVGGEAASGLADMLHQLFAQTLEGSPEKVRAARRMAGRVIFGAAEDESVAVLISFAGDAIEVRDVGPERTAAPSITGDFLSMSHLAAGRESPLALVARGKLRVRFAPRDLPFLVRMLALVRIDDDESARARRLRTRAAIAIVAGAAAAAAGFYAATH